MSPASRLPSKLELNVSKESDATIDRHPASVSVSLPLPLLVEDESCHNDTTISPLSTEVNECESFSEQQSHAALVYEQKEHLFLQLEDRSGPTYVEFIRPKFEAIAELWESHVRLPDERKETHLCDFWRCVRCLLEEKALPKRKRKFFLMFKNVENFDLERQLLKVMCIPTTKMTNPFVKAAKDLADFKQNKGEYPTKKTNLSLWWKMFKIKKRAIANELSPDEMQFLKKLQLFPLEEGTDLTLEYKEKTMALVAFYNKHGHYPSKRSQNKNESKLGYWYSDQKQENRGNTLSEERKKYLERNGISLEVLVREAYIDPLIKVLANRRQKRRRQFVKSGTTHTQYSTTRMLWNCHGLCLLAYLQLTNKFNTIFPYLSLQQRDALCNCSPNKFSNCFEKIFLRVCQEHNLELLDQKHCDLDEVLPVSFFKIQYEFILWNIGNAQLLAPSENRGKSNRVFEEMVDFVLESVQFALSHNLQTEVDAIQLFCATLHLRIKYQDNMKESKPFATMHIYFEKRVEQLFSDKRNYFGEDLFDERAVVNHQRNEEVLLNVSHKLYYTIKAVFPKSYVAMNKGQFFIGDDEDEDLLVNDATNNPVQEPLRPSSLLDANTPHPRGLPNLGNTCYINAVLQLLHPLLKTVNEQMEISGCETKTALDLREVFGAMANLLERKNIQCTSLEHFSTLLGTLGQQHDAHEFLMRLVNEYNKEGNNPLHQALALTLSTTYVCHECKETSQGPVVPEPYLSLPLPQDDKNKISVQHSINQYFQISSCTKVCERCNKEMEHTSCSRISTPPNFCLILFNRAEGTSKNCNPVHISETLNLSAYLDQDQEGGDLLTYSLVGQVSHHGQNSNEGHYTADVLRDVGDTKKWYHFDDTHVAVHHSSDFLRSKNIEQDSYLLLYKRREDDESTLSIDSTSIPSLTETSEEGSGSDGSAANTGNKSLPKLPPAAQEAGFDINNPPWNDNYLGSKKPVVLLNEFDVICGHTNKEDYEQNAIFRQYCQDLAPFYKAEKSRKKINIAKSIVLIVQNKGGRFLNRDRNNNLFEVTNGVALNKTKKLLLRPKRPSARQNTPDMAVRPTKKQRLVLPISKTKTNPLTISKKQKHHTDDDDDMSTGQDLPTKPSRLCNPSSDGVIEVLSDTVDEEEEFQSESDAIEDSYSLQSDNDNASVLSVNDSDDSDDEDWMEEEVSND